jgi:hypothetical protein
VRFECHDHGRNPAFGRALAQAGKHVLVAAMEAIKVADRQYAAL